MTVPSFEKIARRPEYRSVGVFEVAIYLFFTFDCQRFEWPDCVSGEHNLGKTSGGGTGRRDARGNREHGVRAVHLSERVVSKENLPL